MTPPLPLSPFSTHNGTTPLPLPSQGGITALPSFLLLHTMTLPLSLFLLTMAPPLFPLSLQPIMELTKQVFSPSKR